MQKRAFVATVQLYAFLQREHNYTIDTELNKQKVTSVPEAYWGLFVDLKNYHVNSNFIFNRVYVKWKK